MIVGLLKTAMLSFALAYGLSHLNFLPIKIDAEVVEKIAEEYKKSRLENGNGGKHDGKNIE